MVSTASLFNQLLPHFPRTEFAALVRKHNAERRTKGFSCWTQFVAMLFCQLSHSASLREICNGLRCSLGKLVHLGITRSPNKSTLSYANEKRPASLFEDLFWTALGRFRSAQLLGVRRSFRFKNKLLSLDSTTISLCLSLFPWAEFKTVKGGIKAHVLLDHDDYLPSYVLITNANYPDVKAAHLLALRPSSIVVMDLGYIDYELFAKWTNSGIFFVTRLRKDLNFSVLEDRPVPKNRNILTDQTIRFASQWGQKYCPQMTFRRIVLHIDGQEPLVFLTNHLHFGATTLADIYKQRWQIEVFFKQIKQTLQLADFLGNSARSVRWQVWTALLVYVLLRYLAAVSQWGHSLARLWAVVRAALWLRLDLRALLQSYGTAGGSFRMLGAPEQAYLPGLA